MKEINVYKAVFLRKESAQVPIDLFFEEPVKLFQMWNRELTEEEIMKIYDEIKEASGDHKYKSDLKRNLLPAVDLSPANMMSIDIDNISDKPEVKQKIINELLLDNKVYCLQESASGNLVVYYRFECAVDDYQYLYYKKYLELTLKLEVAIDYLPEVNRLRYVSLGQKFIYNKDAEPLTELLIVDKFITPSVTIINNEEEPPALQQVVKGFTMLTKSQTQKRTFKS